MSNDTFDLVKAALDDELDSLTDGKPASVRMGYEMYAEFEKRGLLHPEEVVMVARKWVMPSYRGRFVYDDPDVSVWAFTVRTHEA